MSAMITIMATIVAAMMSTITTATPPMMATVLSGAAALGEEVVIDTLMPPGPTGAAVKLQTVTLTVVY